MGEYDLNGQVEPHNFVDRKVQIVASHPKFDPKTFEYDLALLRFYEPVVFRVSFINIFFLGSVILMFIFFLLLKNVCKRLTRLLEYVRC